MLNIVDAGYLSTHYYVIATPQAKLLIDGGWPGTLPTMRHTLQRMGIPLSEITHLLVTHYHPDHAGLVQELKQQGVKLIVLENQVSAIPMLKTIVKPRDNFVDITLDDNILLREDESRPFLKTLGIDGEIIITPGHSDDSVTLILDTGIAFTGDLPPVPISEDPAHPVQRSLDRLRACHVRVLYPAHGPTRPLE
jgi:ribonuclease/clavin/mitogillin